MPYQMLKDYDYEPSYDEDDEEEDYDDEVDFRRDCACGGDEDYWYDLMREE